MPEESLNNEEQKTTGKSDLSHKLAVIGWSLFLIWIGLAFLMEVNPVFGLLGVGIITLGMQVARKNYNLKLEGFWVVIGLLFVIGSLWNLFQPQVPLMPILMVVAGILLFLYAVRGKRQDKE